MEDVEVVSSSNSEEVDLKKDAAVDDGITKEAPAEAMQWDGNHDDFPMRTLEVPTRANDNTRFLLNPVVSVFAICFLWGLSIWCMFAPDTAADVLIEWRGSVTSKFSWFYVGTNPAFMVR